jgi:hypothetical protein
LAEAIGDGDHFRLRRSHVLVPLTYRGQMILREMLVAFRVTSVAACPEMFGSEVLRTFAGPYHHGLYPSYSGTADGNEEICRDITQKSTIDRVLQQLCMALSSNALSNCLYSDEQTMIPLHPYPRTRELQRAINLSIYA